MPKPEEEIMASAKRESVEKKKNGQEKQNLRVQIKKYMKKCNMSQTRLYLTFVVLLVNKAVYILTIFASSWMPPPSF